MPLDARVRETFERSSAIVDPDVRRDLQVVRRKARRSILRQRITFVLVAAAVFVGAVFLGPRVLDVIRSQRQQPADQPSIAPQQIVGFYGVELTASDGSEIGSFDLAGRWTMLIQGDGLVRLSPPIGVAESSSLPTSYTIAGSRFITTLFRADLCAGSGPGTYRWQRSGSALTFTVEHDDCSIRVSILTTRPWMLR